MVRTKSGGSPSNTEGKSLTLAQRNTNETMPSNAAHI